MTLNNVHWATNPNYSVGPDVGTPTKVDPASAANGFIPEVLAEPTHVNFLIAALLAELVKAIDGVGGGSYSLDVDDLTLSGAQKLILDLAAQLTAGHTLDVDGIISVNGPGGRINLNDGSGLNLFHGAGMNVDHDAAISLEDGAAIALASGAHLDAAAGGLVKFAHARDLQILDEGCFWRSPMIPQWIGLASHGGGVAFPAWADNTGCGAWTLNEVTAERTIRFWLNRLPGDIITLVGVNLEGSADAIALHGFTLPTVMPIIRLVSVNQGGIKTVIASTSDTSADAPTYDGPHLVQLTAATDTLGRMPYTVTLDPLYLEVLGEHGTGGTAGSAVESALRINAVFGTSTSKAFRTALEFA